MKLHSLFVLFVALSSTSLAQTLYVNSSCGDDSWTGVSPVCTAPNGPKRTIQAAIPTDFLNLRIVVEAGLYLGPVQYAPPFNPSQPGRFLTIESEAGAVIDCQGVGTAMNFGNFDRGFVDLRGFTLQNAGTGVRSHYTARVAMHDCIVRDCGTGILNGGDLIAWDTIIEDNNGSPIVQPAMLERVGGTSLNRCIVRNNGGGIEAGHRTGGAAIYDSLIVGNGSGTTPFISVAGSGVFLRNTTIAGTAGPAVTGIAVGGFPPTRVTAHNCILWGNNGGGEQIRLIQQGGTFFLSVQYSTVQSGFAGDGNLSSDPLFEDASGGDFHLSAGSPGIDSGSAFLVPIDVTTDLEGQPRIADDPAAPNTGAPFPSYVDRGAYESGGRPYCIGDLDDDQDVELSDLSMMLAQFGSSGVGLPADQDRSGDVDLADLAILLSNFGRQCP